MPMTQALSVVGMAVGLIAIAAFFPAERSRSGLNEKAVMSARDRNVQAMLTIFRAIEERDQNHNNVERELALYQPDVEFHWPPALPYGGTSRGGAQGRAHTWSSTWNPLQPTAGERSMNPRVIGADDHEVAILYHQRGVSPSGERLDAEVIGLYELRDFKLSHAQMFYFDEAATSQFLSRAAADLRRAR
jgi:ketosteroid isomerase-like protein